MHHSRYWTQAQFEHICANYILYNPTKQLDPESGYWTSTFV
jgi:hypothetical protein